MRKKKGGEWWKKEGIMHHAILSNLQHEQAQSKSDTKEIRN